MEDNIKDSAYRPYDFDRLAQCPLNLNQFDRSDYYISEHFQILWVRRCSRLDVWLLISI